METNTTEKPTLSASQIDLYFSCPLQWKFQYQEKREPDEKFEFLNTVYGTAVHHVLEKLFTDGDDELNFKMPEKHIIHYGQQIFEKKLNDECKALKEQGYTVKISGRQSFKQAFSVLHYTFGLSFLQIIRSKFYAGYSSLKTEEEMRVDTPHFLIRGFIDLLGFFEDGSYDVVDFKTGQYFKLKEGALDHQALFYTFMGHSTQRRFPNQFKFIHINRGTMKFAVKESKQPTDATALELFSQNVELFRQAVEKKVFFKRDESQQDLLCRFCQFRKSCKDTAT